MKHFFPITLIVASCSLVSSLAIAQATPEERAREILKEHKSAIVVVTAKGKLVTQTSGEALLDKDQQRRTLGVTISDTGLIVVSNVAIDGSVGLEGQQARIEDKVVTIQSAKTEYTEVEISYGDSTVLSGRVIRQDKEADVAFILPDQAKAKELNKTFKFVDFSSFGAEAQPADQVVGLSRSSSIYGYMPIVNVGRVTGVFKQDRVFYINTAGTGQGVVVFNLEGEPLGLTVVRIVDGKPTGVVGTLAAGPIQVMADLALKKMAGEGSPE